ncbi:MAG: hypothetical protein B7Y80_17665 [Hyphomicrobium sp. 32-62-53]|jgi:hypothetical protein|nr:MAG: hypothetical protein B7Z29_17140 [Hyphomicrobium sp. 12-62-95]OYX97977.1 MAG: hypothetical protein B7Y80_17665 [Hyphomicrobium sp. 32-62-53]
MAKFRHWNGKRKRAAPAPALHPPGMGPLCPAQAAPRLEPRGEAERRFLQNVTRLQVRGQAQGFPDLMRSDWDRLKLEEAMWLQKRADQTPVDIVKLGRARAMRAQFNGYARVVSASTKSAEGPKAQTLQTAQKAAQQEKASSPSPSPSRDDGARDEAVEESPFMKKLRARAFELATMSREREREQDRD